MPWAKKTVNSETRPTRPTNMAKQRTYFDAVLSNGVIPNDEPVVKTAETDSKITSVGLMAGSSAIKVQLIIMVKV